MKIFRIIFCLSALTFLMGIFSEMLLADNEVQERREITEEIEVIKPYQPSIEDFRKIPSVPDETLDFPEADYPEINITRTLEAAKDIKAPTPAIDPAPVRDPVLDHLYDHYIRVGAGNYRNLLGEYYFNSGRSRDLYYSGHFKHNSGWGPLEYSNTGITSIDLTGKKILESSSIQANIDGDHEVYHYYGFGEGDIVDDPDEIRQHHNRFGADFRWQSINNHSRIISYDVQPFYDYFSTRGNIFNNSAGTAFELGWNLDNLTAHFDGDYIWDHYGLDDEDAEIDTSYHNHLLRTNPHIKFDRENFELKLGMNIIRNQRDDESNYHFKPDVYFSYAVADDFLHLYTGITGQIRHNSHAKLAAENPFLESTLLDIRNTNEKFEFFGGAKGTITNQLGFDLNIAYLNIEDLPFYRHAAPLNRYEVVYDQGTTTLLRIEADFEYDLRERIQLFLNGKYNEYQLSTLDEPFNRPTLEGSVKGRAGITDDFSVNLEIHAMNDRYGAPHEDDMSDGFVDLNAGASYKISSHFSAFVETNNLLNNNYQIWHGYPVRGFHALLGGTVQF